MMRRALPRPLRFLRREDGSITIESVLVLPTLIWGCLATLTYVDGFRTETANLRITYTLADMISRTESDDVVGPKYLDGMARIYAYLVEGNDATAMRTTVIGWDATNDTHTFEWSYGTSPVAPSLTAGTMSEVTDQIPMLADGDVVVIVETWQDYSPAFNIGFDERVFYNSVVTSPRFLPQIKLNPSS